MKKRQQMQIKCCECNKSFTPKKAALDYQKTPQGNLEFFCEKCMDKWREKWTKGIKIVPLDSRGKTKAQAEVTFASGEMFILSYDSSNGDYDTGIMDTPVEFKELLKKATRQYHEQQRGKAVASCDFTEGYEENVLTIRFGNGKERLLHYRYGRKGELMIDPKELAVANLEDEQMAAIQRMFDEKK